MEREFEHRLTSVEDRCESNSHRLEEVEKRQDSLDKLTTSFMSLLPYLTAGLQDAQTER